MPGTLYHRLAARSILIVAAIGAVPARAQQHDVQLWLQINTNVPLSDRLRVTLEQIARFSDRQDGLYQTEFGGILGYKVAPNVELGFGYRKVGSHNGNTGANEDRLRQHVVATFGRLTTRFRVDERFNPRGDEIGFRVRPLLRYNHPLGKGLGLFASHESFFLPNSTAWGQRAGYERMRNVAGMTVPVGRTLSADLGYLNQYRFARGGGRAQVDHALSLQLTLNLGGGAAPTTED
ncbi:MAG: DUF2490 domain-containing protein [Pseudomonadota bacterium]